MSALVTRQASADLVVCDEVAVRLDVRTSEGGFQRGGWKTHSRPTT
jgi:hypothetical protein